MEKQNTQSQSLKKKGIAAWLKVVIVVVVVGAIGTVGYYGATGDLFQGRSFEINNKSFDRDSGLTKKDVKKERTVSADREKVENRKENETIKTPILLEQKEKEVERPVEITQQYEDATPPEVEGPAQVEFHHLDSVLIISEMPNPTPQDPNSHYNMFGFGIIPENNLPVMYFNINASTADLNEHIELEFDGCLGNSQGDPLSPPYLLEGDRNGMPVAMDNNQNGIFDLNEFYNQNYTYNINGNYTIIMDARTCTYDNLPLDIGTVEFVNTDTNNMDTRLVFG